MASVAGVPSGSVNSFVPLYWSEITWGLIGKDNASMKIVSRESGQWTPTKPDIRWEHCLVVKIGCLAA
ncbi:MAG TPA: hypothetical protein DDX19_20590 [Rhodopirellula baltica]|uniref:Uncharacterized protein n=1 Tax=Rhodopirellula baltica (strain DSM 10527 / NCIMB 13988 / SH1) TaxID=243090 RepID=Q7UP07_RHOBA|nr:hypothetical protein RB7233 [Rhodopirellula baltica SH 1]HBE65105.1 hypothetical protein [Rhodopirellula baltica]